MCETQEMVFDAHDRTFALFKGAYCRGRSRLPRLIVNADNM
jgi:hypothetical protein